jgi:hypothetical protein
MNARSNETLKTLTASGDMRNQFMLCLSLAGTNETGSTISGKILASAV